MKAYFDDLQGIERTEFLKLFGKHVLNHEQLDEFELGIFCNLVAAKGFQCYQGLLNKKGFAHLILPHHAVELEPGRNPDRPVKGGGDAFSNVVRSYKQDFEPNGRFPSCVGKITAQQSRFFGADDAVLRAEFLFVSNDKELAHPGHYNNSHGASKIYIGNGFHRFVACGLWLENHAFKPLEVFYAELLR